MRQPPDGEERPGPSTAPLPPPPITSALPAPPAPSAPPASSTPSVGPPTRPVTDAERQWFVDTLRSHCGRGTIDLDQFAERAGWVYEASTWAELDRVLADLPVLAPGPVPETRRRRAVARTIAIMSGNSQRGRWRLSGHTTAVAVMGGCELDLRRAEIDGPEVYIRAIAVMGGIDIVVPEGIGVEVSGWSFMGGRDNRVRDATPAPGTPTVHVRAVAVMGGVTIRNRRPRPDPSLRTAMRAPTTPAIPPLPGPWAVDLGLRHAEKHAREAVRRAEREIERATRRVEHRHGSSDRRPERPWWADAALDALANAVRAEGPGSVRRAAPDGTVTLLFSDIEGFTAMTERLGDLAAQAVLRAHNEIVRAQVASHGGYEVKSQGDSFMVAFSGAGRALRCAIATQRALAAHAYKNADQPIRVRMGLHTGEAINEDGDLFGRTVILASRIASEARGGEILASGLLCQLASSSGEFVFGEPRTVELKGLSQPQSVCEVLWDQGPSGPRVGQQGPSGP